MSVQSEITRLADAKAAIKTAIEGKGVTVPDATMLDGMAALIDTIEAGGGGGGSDTSIEDGLVTRTLTSYTNSRVTSIGAYAFYGYNALTSVNFPSVTSIGAYAFYSCGKLFTADFSSLTDLTGANIFRECRTLKALIIRSNTVCTLSINALKESRIDEGLGYVYVPDNLVSSYKSATNWTTYANKILPLSSYTGA